MGLTRRQAIMASLGVLALGGCSGRPRTSTHPRPIVDWPGYPASPSGRHAYTPVQAPRHQQVVQPNTPAVVTPATGISAISRSKWTRSAPKRSKVNAMNGISKLTIHHAAGPVVNFTSESATADRLESIRKFHTGERGWGDIGYHYIVDRAGRVWEGRPIQYQGAHVRNNNEHNIGILVLGNFDKQSPSSAQVNSLYSTAAALSRQYKIKTKLVRSHQEINTSECPGKNLQNKMNGLRRRLG